MSRAIHVFRTPDRFVAGTVGEPGDRSFYLQAVHESRVVSVLLEKQQVQVLRRSHGLTPRRGTSTLRNRGSATSRRRLRPQPAGHTARRGVPGRHDGARLGRRCRGGRRGAACRQRDGVRRIGCPRRRRRRSGRGPCVPDSGASARVFAAVRTRHRGGTRAVPRCVVNRWRPRGTSASAPTGTDAASPSVSRSTTQTTTRSDVVSEPGVPDVLLEGDLTLIGQITTASNATLVCESTLGEQSTRVVYKPVRGERPLWDFPDGTLAGREVASYRVSEALGWGVIPRTVLRDGPLRSRHGAAMDRHRRSPRGWIWRTRDGGPVQSRQRSAGVVRGPAGLRLGG